MRIMKVAALSGPNYWSNRTVLELWVDLEELKDLPSDELPGFNERLQSWLPSLIEHRCSEGYRGGFFERLRRGTWMAHILEHVTLELQCLAGSEVSFGRARETETDGQYRVAIEYREEALARSAVEAGLRLCLAAVKGDAFDVGVEVEKLRSVFHRVKLGPSTGSIVEAAVERGIPYRRLNDGSLVQFGQGSKQRRVLAAETDRTSAVAESIAQDKELTRSLLLAAGLPAPVGRSVSNAEEAWGVATEIGVPVVVKPQDGNQGRGVQTNLTTEAQVKAAYHAALGESERVLVEKFVPGGDYRLLVVADKVVAAAHREPARVVGDGEHSISQLIDIVNSDPRRGDHHATMLSKIHIDSVALAVLNEQGFDANSIPPAGTTVLIRRNANLSTGGTATDVTDFVHPEIAAIAVEAASVVGLDVAGIDMVVTDIGRPLTTQPGAIIEVNACPGLRMHLEPSSGKARDVGGAIMDTLYPAGEKGRIPIAAVTGVNGKTTVTRLIAHVLRQFGHCVGMTCTDGVYIDGRRREQGDCSGPLSAWSVLMNRKVDAAVFETARGGVLRAGLAFDQCDVAVVTNIGEGDHLGLNGIETLEHLARLKGTIVRAVRREGSAVLNADDPQVVQMAVDCPGAVVYFSRNPESEVLQAHRAAGGRAVFVRDGGIVAAEGAFEIPLVRLDRIPLTHGGRIGFQVENVLAATAAAWQLRVPVETIRGALESFHSDTARSPGRFNLLEIGGSIVVVDYGHNSSALSAVLDAMRHFPHKMRGVVYSSAGDRRDEDMVRQGEMLGDNFDRVILYEDTYLRGRKEGEIIAHFRKGLAGRSRVREVYDVRGAIQAAAMLLQTAQPGELLLIQADLIEETMEYLRKSRSELSIREIEFEEAIAAASPAAAVGASDIPSIKPANIAH